MSELASLSSVFLDVAHGLREAFFMFWETLWALVLGFTLSGIVQAFVSKDKMRTTLGSHRPASVARASGYGMVSSSCSYAASAMSKSLFAKGADFTSAMVFMFASTNLVIELGIVMLILLGWQFAVAEFVGGPIMIVLLALTGGVVFTTPVIARALKRVRGGTPGGHDHTAMSRVSTERQEELEAEPWGQKLRSPAAWSDASSYAVADATMLRKELVIGYTVAGLLAVLVPAQVWNALFLHGHGFWTSLENALVGPLIAVISWVCSIGNVPLAATLWSGGIAFGGVIAFIFADLIAMPLILIYRKFYGWELTARMVGLFYAVMVLAGLATEGIFAALGLVPSHRTFSVSSAHFEWNYTTFLNLIFLGVAVAVWWLARNQERLGGGVGYTVDPVCGMQLRADEAPAHASHEGRLFHFCSDRCRAKFEQEPERYTSPAAQPSPMDHAAAEDGHSIDPVCGMSVDQAAAAAHRARGGQDSWFCSLGCAERFDEDPDRFTMPSARPEKMTSATAGVALGAKPRAALRDPVCKMAVDANHAAARRRYGGIEYAFCSQACAARFDADPQAYRGDRHGA
jgi:YHS domain-containing protein/uncharacterized membrane protein YraQ (UPF0718 family)